ncbi:dihydrolipoyl dehydrogenase [Pseudomonadota bacterium]
MSNILEIKVPDIGDFQDVEIIEIFVSSGDQLSAEDPIISLESDKATLDVPTPVAGKVAEVLVSVGDKVSKGSLILSLQVSEQQTEPATDAPTPETDETDASKSTNAIPAEHSEPSNTLPEADMQTDVVVLGSGPGGYTAAFRSADLGKKTVLVERHSSLGGVCLNVGCIPSKTLLHAAGVISEAREINKNGIEFSAPNIDLDKLRQSKERVVGQLTGGLKALAKKRKVNTIQGQARFVSSNLLAVDSADGEITIAFENAIIAAGSRVSPLPFEVNDDPRIIDSTGALELPFVPKRMLIIGGGVIGLEMATVYHELGAKITVVEALDSILTDADADIIKPLYRRLRKQYEKIYLDTFVTKLLPHEQGIQVSFAGPKAPESDIFDLVLVAIGRTANGDQIGAEQAGVHVDELGFIKVDKQQRTNVSHIFAIGDIAGQPMLAHKASHEGKVAAEVAAGEKSAFEALVIPNVAYTDPEVAWVGLTENEAKQQGIEYETGTFPWAASGRSLSTGRNDGVTKLIFNKNNSRLLGAGIVGPHASELIAEATLAIEMGSDAEDISLTVHAHPTLSETIAFSAEAYEGTITDLYLPRKKA